jgi:hypothetical protein
VPRRLTHALLALSSVGFIVFAAGGTAGASRGLGGLLSHSTTKNAQQSGNWSGYVVNPAGGNVTGVASTFVVPKATLILPGLTSTWAGIGGDPSADLIQAGVSESPFPSNPILGDQYFAWYELLPASPVQLTGCTGDANCTVVPGDHVSVQITQTATNVWTISVADGARWTWSMAGIKYGSSHSSAEWILEAPTLLVAPVIPAGVGSAHFGPTSTFTVGGGSPQTIASGNPQAIDMSLLGLGLFNLATPSALSADGQSFNVCTYAQTCS